jgi:TonB family protein
MFSRHWIVLILLLMLQGVWLPSGYSQTPGAPRTPNNEHCPGTCEFVIFDPQGRQFTLRWIQFQPYDFDGSPGHFHIQVSANPEERGQLGGNFTGIPLFDDPASLFDEVKDYPQEILDAMAEDGRETFSHDIRLCPDPGSCMCVMDPGDRPPTRTTNGRQRLRLVKQHTFSHTLANGETMQWPMQVTYEIEIQGSASYYNSTCREKPISLPAMPRGFKGTHSQPPPRKPMITGFDPPPGKQERLMKPDPTQKPAHKPQTGNTTPRTPAPETAAKPLDPTCEEALLGYKSQLGALIDEGWHPPKPPRKGTWIAQLSYRVNREGQVQDVKIVKSSGYSPIDQSALARVSQAQVYFQPLPACVEESSLEVKHQFKLIRR